MKQKKSALERKQNALPVINPEPDKSFDLPAPIYTKIDIGNT